MDMRLESLKLAVTAEVNDPLETARAFAEFVLGTSPTADA